MYLLSFSLMLTGVSPAHQGKIRVCFPHLPPRVTVFNTPPCHYARMRPYFQGEPPGAAGTKTSGDLLTSTACILQPCMSLSCSEISTTSRCLTLSLGVNL